MVKKVSELTLQEVERVCAHYYNPATQCHNCPIACTPCESLSYHPVLHMANFCMDAVVDMDILIYPVTIRELASSKFCDFQDCENCPIILDGEISGIHIKTCPCKLYDVLPTDYALEFSKLQVMVTVETMEKMSWSRLQINNRIKGVITASANETDNS